jgi:hypothetical protein
MDWGDEGERQAMYCLPQRAGYMRDGALRGIGANPRMMACIGW